MFEARRTQHLAIIAERWPALALALSQAQPTSNAEVKEGGCDTLMVNGIQLTSRHDRVAEAQHQADSLPSSPHLNLYGTGLGDLQRLLLQRTDLKCLTIRIMNRSLFMLSLSLLDHQDWLQDPRVSLDLAANDDEIQLPFFALPAELHLAEDEAHRIRDRLLREITLPYVNRRFEQNRPALQRRLDSNRKLLRQDGDVASLFGKAPGHSAIVMGAGPTLKQHLTKLQALQHSPERPLLIAVDTACRALFAHGIKPDWVVSIDHLIDEEKLPSSDCGLVYFPLVPTRTLQVWRGQRLAAYSTSPLYQALHRTHPKALLYSGGSVIHPATDLAVRMGCREVILMGADFAFPGGETHTGWAAGVLGGNLNQPHMVLNGHGLQVRTSINFAGYRAQLERYISAHPEVQFWNSSREGAEIAGCLYHPEFTA